MTQQGDRKKVIAAVWLHLASVAAIIICRTYSDLLFLTSYPPSLLPAFFLGQTLVMLCLSFGISPLIAKGSPRLNIIILFVLAMSCLSLPKFIDLGMSWLPFAVALWLSAISIFLGVISWNSAGDAFNIRRYKTIVRWISIAGCLGGLIMGLLIPIIIHRYQVNSLRVILAPLILTGACCLVFLRPQPAPRRRKEQKVTPLRYPLFRTLVVSVFLMMILDTFADYCLKSELAIAYTSEQIGTFMGPFYGIASVLSLLVLLFGSRVLLPFGVTILLGVLPAFGILAAIGLLIKPGLWLAATFRLGEMVLRYSLNVTGNEVASAPLPGQMRRKGKLFLKSVATPAGTGLAALCLWIIAEQTGLRGVAVVTIVISLVWFRVLRQLNGHYSSTLKEALQIRYFGLGAEHDSTSTLQACQDLVHNAVRSKDPDVIVFGLQVLARTPETATSEDYIHHLESEHNKVRAMVASTVGDRKDKRALPALWNRLDKEEDPEVLWHLLESLARLEVEENLERIRPLLDNPAPQVRAGAILLLLTVGDLDCLLAGGTSLRDMVYSKDADMRRGAAKAIAGIHAGKFEHELRLLMADDEEQVCIDAIQAAASHKTLGLTKELISRLGYGRISRYASRTLVAFGSHTAQEINQSILYGSYAQSRAAIRTLASITDTEAEAIIMQLVKTGSVIIQTTMAREAAIRARNQPISDAFRKFARQRIRAEHSLIIALYKQQQHTDSFFMVTEINARRQLAKSRFLHWFAVCTMSAEVMAVIPSILQNQSSAAAASRSATALELLDSLAPNRKIKALLNVLEPGEMDGLVSMSQDKINIDDPWLDRISRMNQPEKKDDDVEITEKVMLLRKTSLFAELPGEILLTIAEECEEREMIRDELIIRQGDMPDGLYLIFNGTLSVRRNNQVISRLGEGAFFGELGLLDDSPRMADIIAKTDGRLLFIEKEIFDSITEDLPEVLRAVSKAVIGYLRRKRECARVEPPMEKDVRIEIKGRSYPVKSVGLGGLGFERPKFDAHELKIGQSYNACLRLNRKDSMNLNLEIVELSTSLYHCRFGLLDSLYLDEIELFVLDRQRAVLMSKKGDKITQESDT